MKIPKKSHHHMHYSQSNRSNEKNFKSIKKNTKKCIMHMPTGSGKTRTAINLICDYLKKKMI